MSEESFDAEFLASQIESERPLSLMERRRFLQAAAAVGAGAAISPMLLQRAAGAQSSNTDTILVTVTLEGGNDGFNTLGPFGSGRYRDLRGPLSINEGSAHSAADGLSWHPRLPRLATRFRRGDVAVVQGVGEPKLDQSHFSNLARWQSGSQNGAITDTGWLGRWLDRSGGGQFDGLAIGGQGVPHHMRGTNADVTDLPNGGGNELYGADRSDERDRTMYSAINQMGRSNSGSPWVQRVGEVASQAVASARDVSSAFRTELPDTSRIHTDMVLAARVINLNLGTRVLNVSMSGFDTHDNQIGSNSGAGEHADLLGDLDVALDGFFNSLSAPMAERVVVMIYSEFGRRAESNGSRGTDHGTANHVFLAGRRVRGGLYGDAPPLGALDDRGNFRVMLDFRRVYATVVQDVLGTEASAVLGRNYNTVPNLVSSTTVTAPAANNTDVTSPNTNTNGGGGTLADRAAQIRSRRQDNPRDYFAKRAPSF